MDQLIKSRQENAVQLRSRDLYSDSDISTDSDFEFKKSKRKSCPKTRMELFERDLSAKDKGSYKVWVSKFHVLNTLNIPIYLHAINDSKMV